MFDNLATEDVLDRCLAAASYCLELGNDRCANELMKAEFREAAREISHWQLSGEIKAGLFLLPMEEELISRHGQHVGRMLYTDFVDAFWLQTWTDVPLDVESLERLAGSTTDWHRKVLADRSLRRMIAGRDYAMSYSNN